MKFNNKDLLAGIVVFLVAVPLCLGIALASGAPLFSGLIAGIVGGIVVGIISKSPISVTGPAAGLTAIVLAGITQLGAFETFLLAVVLAGAIQLLLGIIKAGVVAHYFPSNVVRGMLTAIGIIIILKQMPHFFGYDKENEGSESFLQNTGSNSFSFLFEMLNNIHPGATVLGIASILAIIIWDKYKPIKLIPGALLGVIVGVMGNKIFEILQLEAFIIRTEHLVQLPVAENFTAFVNQFTLPDFSQILNPAVWVVAVTMAIVASIETLLTIEATDKMNPTKSVTPTNRELIAQGVGNMCSGLIGGLPLTSVIVRSSANVNSGGTTKVSTITHGFLLLIGAGLFPLVLNQIPLTSLAAILLITGYKLCNLSVFKEYFAKGKYQWVPFLVTVIAIVFTNLLTGVGIGMAVSVIAILRGNIKNTYYFHSEKFSDGDKIKIELSQEVSFLNKAAIKLTLQMIPPGCKLTIDATNTSYIDYDVLEVIKEFKVSTVKEKNIDLTLTGFKEDYKITNTEHITLERNGNVIQTKLTQDEAIKKLKKQNIID